MLILFLLFAYSVETARDATNAPIAVIPALNLSPEPTPSGNPIPDYVVLDPLRLVVFGGECDERLFKGCRKTYFLRGKGSSSWRPLTATLFDGVPRVTYIT
jgi:hypothetical protein